MNEPCPACGHVEIEPLVAACDVLVRRALELLGKRTLTGKMRRPRPDWTTAYLFHHIEPDKLEKSLADAWELIPHVVVTHGCCGIQEEELELALTSYVIDLVLDHAPHTSDLLAEKLSAFSIGV